MIAVVVINYRSEDKTIAFVKNELSKISSETGIVIVDNGSGGESLARLQAAFGDGSWKNVIIVPSEDNLGFAKGNNLGAEVAIRLFKPEVILLANNDIVLETPDVVDKMASKLLSLPEAAEIGPKVTGLDGRLQSPEPFETFWKRHVWLYWSNLFMTKERKIKALGLDYSEKATEGWHYKLSGCFFMVKTSDWQAVGGMDPNTFLYAEEMILSERFARIGKKAYYYPEVAVIHEHGATTRKYYDELAVRDMKLRSDIYYYRTYIGTPGWQFAAARLTYSLKKLFRR